jgi:hypothetical protein
MIFLLWSPVGFVGLQSADGFLHFLGRHPELAGPLVKQFHHLHIFARADIQGQIMGQVGARV